MSPSAAFGGISASESQTTQGLVSDHLPTHTTSTTTTTTMDRRQRMPFRHPLSSRHVFFFTLFIYSSTNVNSTKGDDDKPKKAQTTRLYASFGLQVWFSFIYSVICH